MSERDLLALDAPTHSTHGVAPVVLVVMGVSGSGKSTLAGHLAAHTGWDLQEGDDLHPRTNVEKMSAGQPLTDEDRLPWLLLISEWIDAHRQDARPGIITCSALKRSYRDTLARPGVAFVHLARSHSEIAARLTTRQGHFMPPSLLESQFAALEPLEPDERGIVIRESADVPLDEILARLGCR